MAAAGRAAPAPELGAGSRGAVGGRGGRAGRSGCATQTAWRNEGPRGQVHTGSNMYSQH